MELAHDHARGMTVRRERLDAWTLLQASRTDGTTAPDVAEAIYGTKPTRAQVEKARRKLERFVEEGHAVRIEPTQITEPTLYRPTSVSEREQSREQFTDGSRGSRIPVNTGHDVLTQDDRSALPHGEEGVTVRVT